MSIEKKQPVYGYSLDLKPGDRFRVTHTPEHNRADVQAGDRGVVVDKTEIFGLVSGVMEGTGMKRCLSGLAIEKISDERDEPECDGWYSQEWVKRRTLCAGDWTVASRHEDSVLASSLPPSQADNIVDELNNMHEKIVCLTAGRDAARKSLQESEREKSSLAAQLEHEEAARNYYENKYHEAKKKEATEDVLRNVKKLIGEVDAALQALSTSINIRSTNEDNNRDRS